MTQHEERDHEMNMTEGAGDARRPQSNEAEEGVLCAMMEDMELAWDKFGSRLRSELFYHPRRSILAHAMIDMHVSAMPVDIVTLTGWLRKSGQLDKVGGPAGVTDLLPVRHSPLFALEHYMATVEDMAARRLLLAQAGEMRKTAFDYTQPWRAGLEATEQALFNLHEKTSHGGMVPIGRLVPGVLGQLEKAMNSRGHVTKGIATGMTSLDRITMGIEPGLFILGARPSKGKTAAMMQMALNIGLGQGDYEEFRQEPMDVGIFSLETGDVNLARRALLNLAAVNMRRIADGLLSYAEKDAITEQAKRLMSAKIHIEACYGLSIQDLRARARMMVKRLGLKVIMIDYLQLITSTSKRAQQNRQAEVAEASVGLKHLAHELQIPIIALAQLNREADVARPRASQLRDCGQIEQDADYIALLCDPPEWASQNDPEDCPWTYLGIDLVKNKDGATTNGLDPLVQRFDREFFRLTSLERKLLSNDEDERQQNFQPRPKVDHDRPTRGRGRPRKDGSSGTARPDDSSSMFED
jgi:replicative DNA helicase